MKINKRRVINDAMIEVDAASGSRVKSHTEWGGDDDRVQILGTHHVSIPQKRECIEHLRMLGISHLENSWVSR